jgi:mersacidin/lichenicidin family type 2 lantibiotic
MPTKPRGRVEHPLAQVYLVRALDPVIEIARAISEDFVKRPQFYTRVPDDIARLLADFRSLPGRHPDWPNAPQRAFTSSKLYSRFCSGFAGIRLAAIVFMKRETRGDDPTSGRSFLEAAALVRASVRPLEGTALSAVERTNAGMLTRAMTVLSSKPVSGAFGIAELPGGDWPDGGMFSPQLGYLCESVSQTLALHKPISQPMLSRLQRAAHYGATTIAGVLDSALGEADGDRFADVMHAASGWAAALGEVSRGIDTKRAWTEPAYRHSLTPLEKDVTPPHPSGEIEVEGTIRTASPTFRHAGLGFSTESVNGEYCCCTGDLSCAPNTNGVCSDDCPTETPQCTPSCNILT